MTDTTAVDNDRRAEFSGHVRNGLIDKRPALIAPCLTTADVVDAANFGRENDDDFDLGSVSQTRADAHVGVPRTHAAPSVGAQ